MLDVYALADAGAGLYAGLLVAAEHRGALVHGLLGNAEVDRGELLWRWTDAYPGAQRVQETQHHRYDARRLPGQKAQPALRLEGLRLDLGNVFDTSGGLGGLPREGDGATRYGSIDVNCSIGDDLDRLTLQVV